MTSTSWGQSLSPGNEQREFWGSQAADKPGSRNMGGIKNPAVDALIEQMIFAKDRAELVAATKAMDRVLLWNFYVVPQFNYPRFSRYARWDRFGMPSRCRNTACRDSRRCGGRMPTRQPRSESAVEGIAHGATQSPARARSRHRCAERCAFAPAPPTRAAEMHGMSVFGDLKYPADSSISTTSIRMRRKAGCFPIPSRLQSVLPDVQFVQRLHPQGRRRQGHGADL